MDRNYGILAAIIVFFIILIVGIFIGYFLAQAYLN